jgi:hypothetical protein
VAACSGGGDDTAATTTSQPPTITYDTYVAGIPGAVAHSPAGSLAAISAGEADGRRILVVHPDGRTWATTATIGLPPPDVDFVAGPIEVVDLTGDGEVDFVVPLDGSSVVATDDGGRWRLAPGPDGPYLAGDVHALRWDGRSFQKV